MLLQDLQRSKLDPTDDSLFYNFPRFVTHVDDAFIQHLTDLYRQRLKPNTRILDLMSSWVSHLPEEIDFVHVEGHGMNAEELAANPRLNHFFVQNLNQNPRLPFPDQSFDAVLNTASVQYLQYPEEVFAEVHRVLNPEGIAIVSFSNRMFFQKAIQSWRESSESRRVELVRSYFAAVPGFTEAEVERVLPKVTLLSFLRGASSDPFYAVMARRSQDLPRPFA
jgi:hypothetical protein